MTRLPIFVGLALTLTGCDLFEGVKETLDGLTNPLVVQSVVLGVEAAGVEQEILDEIDIETGVGASVFLADAKDANDLENAPITGATVFMNSERVTETGNGTYTLEPGTLNYTVGATWTMIATINNQDATASFTLPPAPNVSVPSIHSKNESMTLSLAGQGFDMVVGLVANVETGEVTWSNEPEDIGDVYDLATGSSSESLDIPGSAFPTTGAYIVGIAGLTKGKSGEFKKMNTALSNAVAGKMKLFPTAVP